jgi:Flp pilus assembly protein TadD
MDPDNHILHNNLGTALLLQGKFSEAKPHYEASLRVRPYFADALNNMGVVLTRLGDMPAAMAYLNEAIRIAPKRASVYGELAVALTYEGRIEDAIRYYRQALALNPHLVEALNNLAWILATHPESRYRDGTEAVQLARQACEVSAYNRPVCIGTLAAAHAEAGQFDEAIRAAEQARALALKNAQPEIAARNTELLELYRAGKPHRENPSPLSP